MKNYDFCDLYQDKGPAAVRKAIENSCKSVDYDGIPPKFHVNNKGLYKDIVRGDPKTILGNTSGSVCYTTAPCQVGVVSQMS